MIAIGSDDSTKKQICIYSNNGDFQYGYRFKSDGSFEVEWKDKADLWREFVSIIT